MAESIQIVLAGDVMLGRGIDQVLPDPVPPILYEPVVRSALDYVALAERAGAEIPKPVPFDWVWGDALNAFAAADLRIVNLETAVTRADRAEPKGINYRMAPEHVPALAAASIDCCILANNHVLDWGQEGLLETLDSLHRAGIRTAGAGRELDEAMAPARLIAPDGRRVLVHALATETSGVPPHWAAGEGRPGIWFLEDLTGPTALAVADRIVRDRAAGDLVVLSIHWGPNWGYRIPPAEIAFAHELVKAGAVDVLLGHSSHHPKAAEIHRGRPILYGAGDLINDYEGIGGKEQYRPELVTLCRVAIGADGLAERLELLPFRVKNFRLNRPTAEETQWLHSTLARECAKFGEHVALEGGLLRVRLAGTSPPPVG